MCSKCTKQSRLAEFVSINLKFQKLIKSMTDDELKDPAILQEIMLLNITVDEYMSRTGI
jgi:hypothetical protein